MREAFGKHTPWGDEESPALVTAVETALERELSGRIMKGGAKPKIRVVKKGDALVTQGEPGHELFLLLDGVLRIEVDGERIAEVGPGAVLGERAVTREGLPDLDAGGGHRLPGGGGARRPDRTRGVEAALRGPPTGGDLRAGCR